MQNPDIFFIFSAIDYYVAGRYSVLAGLNPTAGNQLHHAVEMCLKGGLAKKGKTLDELKNCVIGFRTSIHHDWRTRDRDKPWAVDVAPQG